MKENIYWDKSTNSEEIRKILGDDSHERFIEFASLLLSRTSNIKEVFSDYLNQDMFCKNWRKIKRKMRADKWTNHRIDFWAEVYRVALQNREMSENQFSYERDEFKNPVVRLIGVRIKDARKRMGWTQRSLAKNIGLSQQTISLIEQGNYNCSFSSLLKIFSALNLRISLESNNEYPGSTDTSGPYSFSFTEASSATSKHE
ncbi:antitoxin HipB [bacterium BMS3Abin10]|nr:antitoxin HipB [bacterium BMS3Abin10]GBE40014.1 antitoxin HipB [bacterium BMS3Bbin08]HDH51777.1 helix-turn-helix domain-containing protein [Nitrospirota bacterium]